MTARPFLSVALLACAHLPLALATNLEPAQGTAPPKRILAAAAGRIGPGGGTVSLTDGIRLVFPAGAVDAPIDAALLRLDPADLRGFPADRDDFVLECTPSELLFRKPVELRVPMPDYLKPEHSGRQLTGVADPDSGGGLRLRSSRIEIVDGESELVMSLEHFCVIFIAQALEKLILPPPASCGPLRIPLYSQGATPECVATSAFMLVRAVNPTSCSFPEFFAALKLSAGRVGVLQLVFSSALSGTIEGEAAAPRRCVKIAEGPGFIGDLKYRVKSVLAFNGHPVMLASDALKNANGQNGHALVLVGYDDQDNFYVANPQQNSSEMRFAVAKLSTEQLGINWSLRQSYFLMEIPLPLDEHRPLVTLSVPSEAAWFAGEENGGKSFYLATWDRTAQSGVSWRKRSSLTDTGDPGQLVATIGGEVTRLLVGQYQPGEPGKSNRGGIELINSDPENDHTVTVRLDIYHRNARKLVYSRTLEGITVEKACLRHVPVEVGVEEFWPANVESAQDFSALLTLVTGDEVRERFPLYFSMQPPAKPPEPPAAVEPGVELLQAREYWDDGKPMREYTYYREPELGLVVLHGDYATIDQDGTVRERGRYREGQREGPWKEERGLAQGAYANGKRDGAWTWTWNTGKKREEGQFEQGRRVGKWTKYYYEGPRETETVYRSGSSVFAWSKYDQQGRMLEQGQFEGSNRVGRWRLWSFSGPADTTGEVREVDFGGVQTPAQK